MRIDSSLLPPSYSSSAKTGSARAPSLLEALAKRDPEKDHMLDDVQSQLKQTLLSVRSSKSNAKEQAKAAAREKITRLKEQIKTLRMMAGADPKAVAQQAARLAKELAAAIKDYASAGGTDIAAAPVVQDPATTHAAPADSGNPEPEADADTVEPDPMPDPDESGSAAENTAVFSKTDGDSPMDRLLARDSAIFEARQKDFDFMNEAKKLADELKSILKQLRSRVRAAHDPAKQDIKVGEDTLRDIDKSLQSIASQAAGPVLNVNV